MNAHIRKRLEQLRADYESVSNRPWQFFYCPILHRDEETELCAGHVVNQALRDADRSWTVQRKDVDNHYGTLFEGDFLALEQRVALQVDEVIANRKLSRQFNPKIVIGGQSVDHYRPQGVVPRQHSEFYIDSPDGLERMALKLSPAEMENVPGSRVQVVVDKDVRLAALASCLKSAHLTLFHLLGYRYAISSGGYMLGMEILGEFFLKTREMGRHRALEEAKAHFGEYQSLVRPVVSLSFDSKGTLKDGILFVCETDGNRWAFQVLIRTGAHMHAVMVPLLEDDESAARFSRFLESPFPAIGVRVCKFDTVRDEWAMSPDIKLVNWPQADLDELMTEVGPKNWTTS
ncbi:MAG: hypothetical protein OXF76_00850 [Caldilineaceae bacterium]|nr:hypothetical protein [Caldilineaceae bacterium]